MPLISLHKAVCVCVRACAPAHARAYSSTCTDAHTLEYAVHVHAALFVLPRCCLLLALQNVYAPEDDPEMKVERYKRTFDQNEELGLNDMKTEGYEAGLAPQR